MRLSGCTISTGRGIGTETNGIDNVFPPDDLWFGLNTQMDFYNCIYICMYLYITVCLDPVSDVPCIYVSADGGRDGLWWPALLGHWLFYTGC